MICAISVFSSWPTCWVPYLISHFRNAIFFTFSPYIPLAPDQPPQRPLWYLQMPDLAHLPGQSPACRRRALCRSEGFPRTGYFIPGRDEARTWQISRVVHVSARAPLCRFHLFSVGLLNLKLLCFPNCQLCMCFPMLLLLFNYVYVLILCSFV